MHTKPTVRKSSSAFFPESKTHIDMSDLILKSHPVAVVSPAEGTKKLPTSTPAKDKFFSNAPETNWLTGRRLKELSLAKEFEDDSPILNIKSSTKEMHFRQS